MADGERSEREEPSPSDRRVRHLFTRGDLPELALEALQLAPLAILELLELAPTALVELLERLRPSLVEARHRVLYTADHAERRHERPLTVGAVEDGAGPEVLERNGVVATAAEAADRDLPLLPPHHAHPHPLPTTRPPLSTA